MESSFTVFIKALSHKEIFATFDTEQEAIEFCELYGWEWMDENCYVWDLVIE